MVCKGLSFPEQRALSPETPPPTSPQKSARRLCPGDQGGHRPVQAQHLPHPGALHLQGHLPAVVESAPVDLPLLRATGQAGFGRRGVRVLADFRNCFEGWCCGELVLHKLEKTVSRG